MKRKLKLGFAMGGGVSLGTFSGAALTETIKQAILYACYEKSKGEYALYDEVEIDAFSGASAGSMALAIMLKSLSHQTKAELDAAEAKLNKDLKPIIGEKKWKDLVAAQVAQDVQEKIWTKEITIEKLLGKHKDGNADLKFEPSLLSRGALERIAKENFTFTTNDGGDDDAFKTKFARRTLLAERVLFASTLANLTGIKYDARSGDENSNPNYLGSEDAFTSYDHREVRVFDLHFKETVTGKKVEKEQDNFPSRWVRCHVDQKEEGVCFSLTDQKTWGKIVATSIACGCFPFAFAPVSLNRYNFEYGKETNWPEEFRTLRNVSKFPFTYIDGGTFNNEPIREAFRLASFLDASDTDEEFDRIIVFVDPNIGSTGVDFRIPVHQKYSLRKPGAILGSLTGYEMIRNTSFDRLVPQFGTLISMLAQQGRVNEADKIHKTTRRFETRDRYHNLINKVLPSSNVTDDEIAVIRKEIEDILVSEKENEVLPAGSLILRDELLRIKKEPASPLALLAVKDIENFCNSDSSSFSMDMKSGLLRALYLVFLDLVMDLTGKTKEHKVIAIAPIIYDEQMRERRVSLPGVYLEAFAGFTSDIPNNYAMKAGRHSAQGLLRKNKLIVPATGGNFPPFTENKAPEDLTEKEKNDYINDFKGQEGIMSERIEQFISNIKMINIGLGVERLLLKKVYDSFLRKKIFGLHEHLNTDYSQWYQFRINVGSNKRFEIDGRGKFNDISSITEDGRLYFIPLEIKYWNDPENPYWENPFVQTIKSEESNYLIIDRDGFAFLKDGGFCKIELPANKTLQLARLYSNPVFTIEIGEEDKGKILPASRWLINDDVSPLDEIVL